MSQFSLNRSSVNESNTVQKIILDKNCENQGNIDREIMLYCCCVFFLNLQNWQFISNLDINFQAVFIVFLQLLKNFEKMTQITFLKGISRSVFR
eukprot:TRINITY_DN32762_c0_g1_i9.p3 TRINITY_DN32762_c0_g1~~TRINITY_DN32762_c0_g1_i9.p3  ORF type:complete len:108 (-),score=3.02 TRINITY_DN32762_c0_g1_i9:336-617(-)